MTCICTKLGDIAQQHHETRPIVETVGDVVGVLCEHRHVVLSMHVKEWPGSDIEAKTNDPNWRVTCHGTLPIKP